MQLHTSTFASLIPWLKPTNSKRFVKMHWITYTNQRLLLQKKNIIQVRILTLACMIIWMKAMNWRAKKLAPAAVIFNHSYVSSEVNETEFLTDLFWWRSDGPQQWRVSDRERYFSTFAYMITWLKTTSRNGFVYKTS